MAVSIAQHSNGLYQAASIAAWPFLMLACISVTAWGFAQGTPIIAFNIAYLYLIVSLLLLERAMPHEDAWNKSDGQIVPDIAHTISSKGTVQLLLLFSGTIGLSELLRPMAEAGHGIWPREWPLAAQVLMGVVIAEFPLYWAHRLGHEWPFMWRFHAVHHSVTKLWFVNTGRFHIVDSLVKVLGSMALLLALGAPVEIVQWLSAITAFIGLLTHCNVDMRCGVFNYVFNTPELHRWHHSKDLREGNKNYCENIMIWDHVFGTFFHEPWRRPPVGIGIKETMPVRFIDQLIWPFTRSAGAEIAENIRKSKGL